MLTTVLLASDLDAMVSFLVDSLGGRVDRISPADDPSEVHLDVGGGSLCVRRSDHDVAGHLVLAAVPTRAAGVLTAPNGTVIEIQPDDSDLVVPAATPSFSLVRAADQFGPGRAGMGYRDLLPGRWGGRFIASHIVIADGGDVADYVHYHRVRFQMIFCARGWVDLVYEDQGEPFRLHAGDCVLQPPEIRHRVLRSSPELHVIEIGCPAVHDTMVEHDIALPTVTVDPERIFSGQRFTRHVAAATTPSASLVDGCRRRDTGIGAATNGLAGAVVYEAADVGGGIARSTWLTHHEELVFDVVLDGDVTLHVDVGDGEGDGDGETIHRLAAFDAVALPPGARWRWSDPSGDLEVLEVSLGAGAVVAI